MQEYVHGYEVVFCEDRPNPRPDRTRPDHGLVSVRKNWIWMVSVWSRFGNNLESGLGKKCGPKLDQTDQNWSLFQKFQNKLWHLEQLQNIYRWKKHVFIVKIALVSVWSRFLKLAVVWVRSGLKIWGKIWSGLVSVWGLKIYVGFGL